VQIKRIELGVFRQRFPIYYCQRLLLQPD
jgi:hypothetical protein